MGSVTWLFVALGSEHFPLYQRRGGNLSGSSDPLPLPALLLCFLLPYLTLGCLPPLQSTAHPLGHLCCRPATPALYLYST